MDGRVSYPNTGRRLNHVEFAHRPGEGELVMELFQALGCTCQLIDTPPFGKYIVVGLDGASHGENDIFVTELEAEQLALESVLQRQIDDASSEIAAASAGLRRLQKERPYRATHIGIRFPSVSAFDEVIGCLELLCSNQFAERLELGYGLTRSAEEARSMTAPMKQIWLWTDVISTGLLTFGQQIELQAYDA